MRNAAAAVCLALSLPAAAGSISGLVIDKASGGAISGMTVRLWAPVYVTDANGTRIKSWSFVTSTTTTPGYSFSGLAAQPYQVDTLPGSGLSFEYTDRWYAPNEATDDQAGFVNAAQLDGSQSNSGINIYVLRGGGVDGVTVDPSSNLLNGVLVRAELSATPAIHHNDTSGKQPDGQHPGQFSFRNLVPGTYEFVSYFQLGTYETKLTGGPAVSSSVDQTLGSAIQMSATSPAASADPYNGASHDISAAFPLSRAPHAVFRTTVDSPSHAAIIAPLGADVDGFCFPANPGDRFKLEAHAAAILGSGRANPWFDPVMSFSGPGLPIPGFRTFDDDDGGGLDPLIPDTGELAGGTYCARVGAFGDANLTGSGGNSTGRFDFTATLLDRRPKINSLTYTVNGGASATSPAPPAAITLAEGDTIDFTIAFSDADADPLTVTASLVDVNGTTVLSQTLPHTGGTTHLSWTLPPGSAGNDPYTVTFGVADSPTDSEPSLAAPPVVAILDAEAPPIQLAPDDGARLSTDTPALTIQDVVDGNLSGVQYQFELYDGTGTLMPQSGVQAADASGITVFTPAPLPENALVTWRARTLAGGTHSAWTGFRHFLIDVTNEAPPPPVLVKPADGDEVPSRQPGFSASVGADPEGDAISLVFQIASDSAFTTIVETSAPVPVTLANLTTPWTPATVLAWSGSYFARVYALDALGAQSDFSNVAGFSVRPDALPAMPPLQGPFAQKCQGAVLNARPPTIALGNVQDPDGEAVTLQLQLFDFAADETTATPLLDVSQAESAGATTSMDVSAMQWTEDAHYKVRARAGDGTLFTPWDECDFTLDAVPGGGGGGTPDGGPGEQPDGGAPPVVDGAHRGGCNSSAAGLAAALGLAALLLLRRRSVNV